MVQQETRKLDGQCVDFCDILKDRCCFFSQTDCMPKTVRWNVQKNYRRTATRAVSTDCLWEIFYRCYTVCPFAFNDCIMLRTIRERIFNKNPKISDTRKYCCNHLINWTIWIYLWVICPNNAERVANSVEHDDQSDLGLHFLLEWKTDPDQTAPTMLTLIRLLSWSSLIWVFRPVCPKLLIISICV